MTLSSTSLVAANLTEATFQQAVAHDAAFDFADCDDADFSGGHSHTHTHTQRAGRGGARSREISRGWPEIRRRRVRPLPPPHHSLYHRAVTL